MHHYPHHIGDFDKSTRHLSRIERSIYRDLLDLYYDSETRLPLDLSIICRKVLAKSNDESTAVEQVLNEFFTKTATGWYQVRCEEVIEEYQSSTSQKSLAGKASAAKRALKRQQALNDESTAVEQALNGTSTNLQPTTYNQEPLKSKAESKKDATATRLPADWCPSDADLHFCKSERPDLQADTTASSFKDFWIAQPGVKGRKTDWSATWRNWVRNQRAPQARASPYMAEKFDPTTYMSRNRAKGEQQNERTITLNEFGEPV